MKKNSQLHIWIETPLFEKLKREAEESGMGYPELCRKKLRDSPRLDRLEFMIERLEKMLDFIGSVNNKKHLR